MSFGVMNLRKAASEFFQGFRPSNRCPNCDGSFFKKGKGALVLCLEFDGEEEKGTTELHICLECFEQRELEKEIVMEGLELRGWKEADIEMAMETIDEHSMGKVEYYVISDPRDIY